MSSYSALFPPIDLNDNANSICLQVLAIPACCANLPKASCVGLPNESKKYIRKCHKGTFVAYDFCSLHYNVCLKNFQCGFVL